MVKRIGKEEWGIPECSAKGRHFEAALPPECLHRNL